MKVIKLKHNFYGSRRVEGKLLEPCGTQDRKPRQLFSILEIAIKSNKNLRATIQLPAGAFLDRKFMSTPRKPLALFPATRIAKGKNEKLNYPRFTLRGF